MKQQDLVKYQITIVCLTQVEGYVDANWTDQLFDFKQENVIKIVLFIVMKNWMRLLKL